MTEATKKTIIRLKEVKAKKKLSCQDIADACEEQGCSVSLSSVKRFFAPGSEDGHDYRSYTIDAIARAVIGTDEVELSAAEEAKLTDTGKEIVAENAALKALVELHEKSIEQLNMVIETLNERRTQLEAEKAEMQVRLETITDMFRIAMESLGKSVSNG